MKILLLKQNPDPFVKRLSPGATLFSQPERLSLKFETHLGGCSSGDKSLFLIPHVGIVASFQGSSRFNASSFSFKSTFPSPLSYFSFLSTPWLDRKSNNRGSDRNQRTTMRLFFFGDETTFPLPLLNLFLFDDEYYLTPMITQREREREIIFDPLKDPFTKGGTRLEGGGSDRAGFEHSIFQTGP